MHTRTSGEFTPLSHAIGMVTSIAVTAHERAQRSDWKAAGENALQISSGIRRRSMRLIVVEHELRTRKKP